MADASKNDVPRAADMRVRSSFPHFVYPSPFTCAIRTPSTLSCNAVHPCNSSLHPSAPSSLHLHQHSFHRLFCTGWYTLCGVQCALMYGVLGRTARAITRLWMSSHNHAPSTMYTMHTHTQSNSTTCSPLRIAPTSIATISHASLTIIIFILHSWTKRSGSS